jgi:hypothetical protein
LGGLIGIAGVVFAIIFGLGVVEYLGGKKKSPATAPVTVAELKKRLIAMNSLDSPYGIQSTGDTTLLLEWKIADAKWWGILAKERLKEVYRAYILLDESRSSVRYCEETLMVHWVANANGSAPTFAYQRNFFRGRILYQKTWDVQYGIKEDLSFGKVYEIHFDVRDVRNPVKKVVEVSGWEFVPVIRKAHATAPVLKNQA